MKTLPIVASALVAAGCSDTIIERYATVEDARRAGLFERGWLPNALPASAHDIEARNDLDLNVSTGEFIVETRDVESFTARLAPYSGDQVDADVHLAAYLEAKKKEGLRAGVLRESHSLWAFVCDPQNGRCTYSLAAER